jgi:hypothetical protein
MMPCRSGNRVGLPTTRFVNLKKALNTYGLICDELFLFEAPRDTELCWMTTR